MIIRVIITPRYLNNNNSKFILIFRQPQNMNHQTENKNSLFSINNLNNQPQKLILNNNYNFSNTINININNPNMNANNNIVNRGNKFVKQSLNYSEMNNEELSKYVVILGKDQAGCRLLQKRISEDPTFSNDYLFHQMQFNMTEFMYDAFGNYLIQKILENVSDEKIQHIIKIIEPEFLDLGYSPHGTRVIQKIIEVIIRNKDLINCFVKVFEPNVINLMKDVNGNHIIIKYVFALTSPLNDFIFNELSENIVEICTHKHGCCVLQKCIEGANEQQRVIFNC